MYLTLPSLTLVPEGSFMVSMKTSIPFSVCEEGEAKTEGFGNRTMVTMATHRSERTERSTCMLS